MPQISTRVTDELIHEIDRAARSLRRTRAQFVRAAIEYYLQDVDDLRLGLEALKDPSDPVLDWAEVRRDLLDQD